MNKNFIVGLSALKYFGTLEDLNDICRKYNNIINTWYISPPFGEEYISRSQMLIIPTYENLLEIFQQIEIIKNNNQKIQLALNGPKLKQLDPKIVKDKYNFWVSLYGKPDSIVLLDELIPYFLDQDIPLIYSYNNNYILTKFKNLQFCNAIVLGNKDIRNISFMYKLKEKFQIKIELLVNNGCHFLCQKDCSQCNIQQQNRINKIGKYQALAEQSLLPEELNNYPLNIIDYYKISSRPIRKNSLDLSLQFYSNKISTQELTKQIDLTNINNWKYFARLVPLLKNFQNEIIDVNQILNIKNNIWQNSNRSHLQN